jgi:ABC-type branched-subunit amino acid transport system permease subunit
VVWITGTYLGAGAAFAVVFVTTGVQRIDPVARQGTWGFRVLIVPGVMLLWPLLARRWAVGSIHPPTESNAHRRRARRQPEGA